ncbi:c-type cytochrome [Paraburkholderia sp.]|uniref:c-type cytochrome n=1 Tax=Paraburkholderia sp. TaxID=1926495 RepID=UPI0039E4F2EB
MKNKATQQGAFSTARSRRWLLATCLSIATQASAFAQTPARSGASIAQQGIAPSVPACASCHGASGEGNTAAGFPRLAGLPSGYLQEQLADFAAGTRQQTVMSTIAKALPMDARESVAKYFASLPAPSGANGAQKPVQANPTGERLALIGNWKEGVPACVSCHGDAGSGVGEQFPALAGQPAAYLRAQLVAWKHGARSPGPLGLMSTIAGKLSDSEADAAADYFASLPAAAHASASPPAQGAAR